MSHRKGSRIIVNKTGAPLEYRWTRIGGAAEQIFQEGSFEDLLLNAEGMKYAFDSITIRPKNNGVGEWYRLEAAQNGEDVTEDYEVDGSSLTQNTLTNLNVRARYIALGYPSDSFASVFSKIAAEVRKKQNGTQTYQEMRDAVGTIFDDDLGYEFMDDLDRYGDQFLNAQYCFRRTITVADRVFSENAGAFADNYQNTNRIFTEQELRDEEEIPDEFELPKSIIDNNVPAEWLKMPSRARYTLGHNRSIVREYLFADSWSRLKYAVKQ